MGHSTRQALSTTLGQGRRINWHRSAPDDFKSEQRSRLKTGGCSTGCILGFHPPISASAICLIFTLLRLVKKEMLWADQQKQLLSVDGYRPPSRGLTRVQVVGAVRLTKIAHELY